MKLVDPLETPIYAFQGVWIPAQVWLDKRINALDKVIYAEIDSWGADDERFETNEYLADFCITTEEAVQDSLLRLQSLGYIKKLREPKSTLSTGSIF